MYGISVMGHVQYPASVNTNNWRVGAGYEQEQKQDHKHKRNTKHSHIAINGIRKK